MQRERIARALSFGVAVLAVALPMGAVSRGREASTEAAGLDSAEGPPECPGEVGGPVFSVQDKGKAVKISGVTLSGPIANIPEFHDCQNFLRPVPGSKELVYDSLFGIFAAFRLDSRWDSLPYSQDSVQYDPTHTAPAISFATIFSKSLRPYEPLGIQPGFNCLFVFQAGPDRYGAKMVPLPADRSDCKNKEINLRVGKILRVQRDSNPNFTIADYPKTARWDWDSVHNEQYIGIMCGAAWCEVGERHFVSSNPLTIVPAFEQMGGPVPAPTWNEIFRVVRIKGWYDRQMLARVGSNGRLVPSGVFGFIIPHPSLEDVPEAVSSGAALYSSVYHGRWANVGAVLVSHQYKSHPPGISLIHYCHPAGGQDCPVHPQELTPKPWKSAISGCNTGWIAQLGRVVGAHVGEGCARVTNHKAELNAAIQSLGQGGTLDLPGTARWRWLTTDESGGWFGCEPYSCCKT